VGEAARQEHPGAAGLDLVGEGDRREGQRGEDGEEHG
jgi:hypothetical protein